jgi:hypothetical protein
MRLTLRNLLRFLDQTNMGSLERQRLEELVSHSDRAPAWIERIKRLRSDAQRDVPPVDGPPPPSEVALYLDGAMSEQETVEFEEAMLASDELLAEVASCHLIDHRIRTSEPVAVPVVLRQTLYDLDRLFEKSDEITAAAAAGEFDPVSVMTAMEDLPFVDEDQPDETLDSAESDEVAYSRVDSADDEQVSLEALKRRASQRSTLVALLALLLLASAVALAFWIGRNSAFRDDAASLRSSGQTPALPGDSDQGSPGPGEEGKRVVNETPVDDDSDPAGDGAANDEAGDASSTDVDGQPVPDDGNANSKPEDSDVPAAPPAPSETADGGGDLNSADAAPPVADSDADMDSTVGPPVDEPPPDPVPSLPVRPDLSLPDVAETPVPPAPALFGPPVPPMIVATSRGPGPLVLLERLDGEGDVRALVADEPLYQGTRISVLTGGAAELAWGPHLTLTVMGPASVALGPRDPASGADTIALDYGMIRVVSSEPDVDWQLQIGPDLRDFTMNLADSRVDVYAQGWLPPGADPRDQVPVQARMIWCSAGRVTVREAGQHRDLSPGSAVIEAVSADPGRSLAPQAGTLEGDFETPRYVQRISETVEDRKTAWIAEGTDVVAELADLKLDNRQELRLAAMTWLAERGNFDYVVDYLGNVGNRSNWRTFVQALRFTIWNRPGMASSLYEGLVFAGKENQDKLYEMIVGISPEDLEAGADARLVEYLNNGNLAVRILAIENLREITGGVTYGYQPTGSETERERIINNRWKTALERGEIRWSVPPAIPIARLAVPPPADSNAPDSVREEPPDTGDVPEGDDSGNTGEPDANDSEGDGGDGGSSD